MIRNSWKSCKLQYSILITLLVLAGGLVVSFPSPAEIPSLGENPVTMDFRDVDLKDAIGTLSVITGWNIVVDKDVEGKVNVRFEDVPALQVLGEILEISECQYEIEDNIIKVSRMPILNQSLFLEYALVSSVAPYLDSLISSEGSFQLDEETNTVVLNDKKKNLENIIAFLQQIDTPDKQIQSKSFSIRFIPVDSVVFLLEDYLSPEGNIEADFLANTLLLTETNRNFVQLEELLLDMDVYRAMEKIFTLRHALASSVAPLLENYLGPEDKLQVNEQTNEIILSSDLFTLEKIAAFIANLDTPAKQLQNKSFVIKYIYLDEMATMVEENLSSFGEIIGDNQDRSLLVIKDTPYSLSRIGKLVEEVDIFVPARKTYQIEFAPLFFMAEQIEDLLSREGSLEIREKTSSVAVVDVRKNLDMIDEMIKKEDILENQLVSPVQFEEESLRDVLKFFSDEVRINMFVSPEVQGEVTLRLGKPIPFLEALEAVLSQNYCQYEIKGNIITISKIPLFSRSFFLEYALASSIAFSANIPISPEGSLHLDEATNTIIVEDKEDKIEEISAFIRDLDTPAKQRQSESFTIRFLPVDNIASLLEGSLSAGGEIRIDPLANTLLLTETSRNFAQLEELILNLDVYRPEEEIFTLKYALASSVAPLLENYLGPEDELKINEQTNEIILSSDLYTLEKIGPFLDSLDTPAKQLQSKSFTVKYLYLEELTSMIEENLSPLGEVTELNRDRGMVAIQDTSYNLSKIEELISKVDIFFPVKEIYQIRFAPLSSLAEAIGDLLSEEGKELLKTSEHPFVNDSGSIVVRDARKNQDKVYELVSREDTLEAQLIREKRYVLKYLTPYEAKYHLEVNNLVSEYGEIDVPVVRENVNDQSEYIIIPQETVESTEGIEIISTEFDLLKEEENVIYVTDLRRNIPMVDAAIAEMNSSSRAEEIINRTFYIEEGSLERIALAMANILGIEPGDIEGLEPKGEWMQIEVPTPEINLGTLGPR